MTVPHERHPLKGRLLATFGVLLLSPDALLVRLIGADEFTLMFGRGLFILGATLLILAIWGRGAGWRSRPILYRSELVAGFFYGMSSCMFVPALVHTNVASALVIIAAAPLIAAFAGWLIYGEVIARRTWWVAGGVVAGLAVIFGDGFQAGGVTGNLFAFGVACALAGMLVTLGHNPKADNRRGMVIGATMMILVSSAWAEPASMTPHQWGLLAILGLVVLPIPFVMIGLAARHVSPSEVSVLMLLESVFGPLWVFLVLNETPGATVIGAAAWILGLLLWHQWPRRRPVHV